MKHGGRQPERGWQPSPAVCDRLRFFCVTTKQEAKHVLFAPTTKPCKSLHSEVPVPSMGMSGPESIGFSIPLLCPHEAKLRAASFPCRAVLVLGKKSGMKEAERISRVCAVTLTEAVWHVTTHGHPPRRVQELPVDGQVRTASVASIPSLQPGLCDHNSMFLKSYRRLSGIKFCLADVFVESMPHSASRNTAWDY